MKQKVLNFFVCVAAALLPCAAALAEDDAAKDAAPAEKVDEALENEIKYVEALIEYGFPDFAEPVIEATKKKWPESEVRFFAIEIRGLLCLGKFDEAEKKIAALPDRTGSKYWAARLEVANNYFGRGKKAECAAIYDEFFKKHPGKPTKELKTFYLTACYTWGQILVADKKFVEATETYQKLLDLLDKKRSDEDANIWCNVACETAEMYLKLADEGGDAGKKYLAPAKKLVDALLWEQDRPVFFGRAVAMKAHVALLKGDIAGAQTTIDEYMDQLADIHKQIVEVDPEGKLGLLKQSPMPLCRYMLAELLWKGAQAEAKKPKVDDEKVKSLLFGEKKNGGKRNGAGAFNHALNVFIKYPESVWAAKAGDLSETVRAFAEKKYKAKIKTSVTQEQMNKVRAMQFRGAQEKLAEGDYAGAVKDYLEALAGFPEGMLSIGAIEQVVRAYLDQIVRSEDKAKQEEWRIDADAVEGYLAERFAGNPNRELMTAAGDTVVRLAALEKARKYPERAVALYKAFLTNYRNHVNAPTTAAGLAGEAQKDERWQDAIDYWRIVANNYTNSPYFASAFSSISYCLGKLDDRAGAIKAMNLYVKFEKNAMRREQARLAVAQMYQQEGFDLMAAAESNSVPEEVEAMLKRGSAQIIRGIMAFKDFAVKAQKAIDDPGTTKSDKEKYAQTREVALFLVANCWGRLTKPEAKLESFRKSSAAGFEAYLKEYPKGKYATLAYVKLGTIYTALNDMEKSKDALDRLTKEFPDSDEAKNAKPRLAKSLIEMGMKKEGTQIYAEMMHTDGKYSAGQFLQAGNALIDARSWDLANQAFEKAISLAGTNSAWTVGRARLGQAKTLFKQGSLAEAHEALDLFLDDPKNKGNPLVPDAHFLMVEVASQQGRTEKDKTMRGKYFGAAIGSLKKVRQYWAKKPQHEQDSLSLISADVMLDRAKAEDAMGLKEEASDSRERAATTLMGFEQSHCPTADHPLDKMEPGELANLERCYATMVPVYASLGSKQAANVMKFGQRYLDYFPNGKARTQVENCMNQAKADLGGAEKAAAAVAEADKPVAEETESEEPDESVDAASSPRQGDEKSVDAASSPRHGDEKSEEAKGTRRGEAAASTKADEDVKKEE